MTSTDARAIALATDTTALEADPVAYMTVVLHRAKSWLDEAQNIDDVRDAKCIAIGYESVIREKEMAFDAQLAATEIVRRCERRVGELVRQGQAEGIIARRGSVGGSPGHLRGGHQRRTAEIFQNGQTEREHAFLMADAPTDQFDAAIEEAKAEGNLSRANVVRKVKGEQPKVERSEWHHKKRHIDSNRIVRETARALDAACMGLDLVDFTALDVLGRMEWIESIGESLITLREFLKTLQRTVPT